MLSKDQQDIIAADIEVRNGNIDRSLGLGTKKFKKMLRKATIKMYRNKGEGLFRFTLWFRLVCFTKKTSFLGIVSRIFLRKYRKKYQVKISCKNIGKGLHIVHDTNCYINAEKIGDYFTIFQGATVGVSRGGKPTIGNNVSVYTNAVVCGKITVGDNCKIGACAFLNKSLPANSTVISSNIVIDKNNN